MVSGQGRLSRQIRTFDDQAFMTGVLIDLLVI
jgi:hypothetical protein